MEILFDLNSLGKLEEATFLERPNRFKGVCEKEGSIVSCHIADPGRLKEIFIPGRKVLIIKNNPELKTDYKLIAVKINEKWILINTSLHSKIGEQAIKRGVLGFMPKSIKKEVKYKNSRIDYLVDNKVFVELKGTNLLQNNCCLFPDAPTKRGTKHLKELINLTKEGYRAIILFLAVVDCKCFKPNKDLDKEFSKAFINAMKNNVEFKGFKINISNDFKIHLSGKLGICEEVLK